MALSICLSVKKCRGTSARLGPIAAMGQCIIVRKQISRDFKYAIGNEGGGKNIDGIVHVSQKDRGSENNGCQKEKSAPYFFVPKKERHQKRKTGVPGKKEVPLESQRFIKAVTHGDGIKNYLPGINSQVRQADEERPKYYEERDRL